MEKNLKKRILTVFLVIVGVLIVLGLLVHLLTKWDNGLSEEDQDGKQPIESVTIEFSTEYVTDEEELLSDDKYLGYDRTVYYVPQAGVVIGLTEDSYDDYGACTELICNFLTSIINGDADSYNEYFSELYYKTNAPQAPFSMQKLYAITITPYSETDKSSDGRKYTEYIYALDYRIRRNNGSLRPDIDSDGIRTQYIVLTDREGDLKIDRLFCP